MATGTPIPGAWICSKCSCRKFTRLIDKELNTAVDDRLQRVECPNSCGLMVQFVDPRPNYHQAKCCLTCKYFDANNYESYGRCTKHRDKDDDPIGGGAEMLCDDHKEV